MFGSTNIRYKLAVLWVLIFFLFWVTLYQLFDIDKMGSDLEHIIEGIEKNDWKQAGEYNGKFHKEFLKRKYFIQMNNATEIYVTFEHSVEQLDLAVRNRHESALEYAGLVRGALNYVFKPFTGP